MYNDLINKHWIISLFNKGHSIHSIHLISKEPVSKIKEILCIK